MIHKELKKDVRAYVPCLKTIYNWINEFDKKKALKALIESEPNIGYSHIEAATSLLYSTIFNIIQGHLYMKNIALSWVPHDLTEANQKERVQLCE